MRPGCTFLQPVGDDAAPRSRSTSAVGEHLGVDAEIVLVAAGAPSTASGMAPMPICSVEPSSTRSAMMLADARLDLGLRGRGRARGSGRSVWRTRRSRSKRHRRVLPCVRGICSLISAMHDARRVSRGGQRGVDRGAERAVAVAVGRRELQQRHVERHLAASVNSPGMSERKIGHEVGAALVDRPCAAARR